MITIPMEHKTAVIPITFIKDLFNAGKTTGLPVVDVVAFEAYGSLINLGRGYPGGRYSSEKVCIKMDFPGRIHYYRLDWIWAGGLYGSRFSGPSETWEGEDFVTDDAEVCYLPSLDTSGDAEFRDIFDASRSPRHRCALKAWKKGEDLVLRFTYAEQQEPVPGLALQTTIQCRTADPAMIKMEDARLKHSLLLHPQ
ncbi:MAG: hypothetical protein PHP59_04970 [Methanofollis sp.]|uniref:hypothetical protein n=1 Tax=Methanofollis sp. TaxID=2052835 RepID=UPI0026274A66|nr:hypothetical protein [Methanofollis sp.]MDD4254711.1 hypothetical protein [Methanofollis sp.]